MEQRIQAITRAEDNEDWQKALRSGRRTRDKSPGIYTAFDNVRCAADVSNAAEQAGRRTAGRPEGQDLPQQAPERAGAGIPERRECRTPTRLYQQPVPGQTPAHAAYPQS